MTLFYTLFFFSSRLLFLSNIVFFTWKKITNLFNEYVLLFLPLFPYGEKERKRNKNDTSEKVKYFYRLF